MKNRKLATAMVAALMALGVAGTALAAPTVPGAVYGTESSQSLPREEVSRLFASVGVIDVPATHYAAGSIAVLMKAGFMQTNAAGQINPNEGATVDAATAIFAKVLGIASKTDDDVTAAKKAEQAGLLDNRTDIERDMTRIETAKLLARALGIHPKAGVTAATFPFKDVDSVFDEDLGLLAALYDAGVFKGFEDRSFRPNNVLTKAQIAVLVDRILGAQK